MNDSSYFLDEVDFKILDLLQNDGKLTSKNLANQIKLTQTPVYERIRKLERNGVIRKYVALLDSKLLDKNLVIFMNITIREHSHDSREILTTQLSDLDEVIELYHTSGLYDFMAKIRVSNVKDYRDFLVNKISPIENIKDMVSHIVLDEIKYSTSIPID